MVAGPVRVVCDRQKSTVRQHHEVAALCALATTAGGVSEVAAYGRLFDLVGKGGRGIRLSREQGKGRGL